MAISFDRALGVHEQALSLRINRAEILANNLANADTPGFKARDLDFKATLREATKSSEPDALALNKTNALHQDTSDKADGDLLYRTPMQPSLDGNTVDSQYELAQYMRNNMDFQTSFQFLNGSFRGLMTAIRGES